MRAKLSRASIRVTTKVKSAPHLDHRRERTIDLPSVNSPNIPQKAQSVRQSTCIRELPLSNTGSGIKLHHPSSAEQEDADLQQAIAASVATSNMHSPQPQPQESGVADADTSLPYFGPANRQDYNQNEWAMVTLNHTKPEPEPSRRKRDPVVPAFLRCRTDNVWETHRLGALVTILHSIPAARNDLLRSGNPPPGGYGHDPEWWKGKAILRPAVQAAQDAGELTWGEDAKPDWSQELHRLIAFLDGTERSYGTVDMLADTKPSQALGSNDTEFDFFEYLRLEPGNAEKVRSFTSTAQRFREDEGPTHRITNDWALLDIACSKQKMMNVETLYNVLDSIFLVDKFFDGDLDHTQIALITEPAEVMTMRVGRYEGLPKVIEIPRVLHIDRYLAGNRNQIWRVLRELNEQSRSLNKLLQAEREALMWTDEKDGREHSRIELAQRNIARLTRKKQMLSIDAQWRMHEEDRVRTGVEGHYFPDREKPDDQIEWNARELKWKRIYESQIRRMEKVKADTEAKLQGECPTSCVPLRCAYTDVLAGIYEQRDAAMQECRRLEAVLTVPSENEALNPTHSYTLRGVANGVDTFYVCLLAEPDLMEIDDMTDTSPLTRKEQWWKLGYVNSDDEPIKTEMTTYDRVMEEACGVGGKPLLFYATDKAMAETPDPLSDALQTFVRFDNRLFKQELIQEPPRDKKRGAFTSPASPSKRVTRSTSYDSINTNAASAGDLDDDMRDAPFETEDPFLSGDGAGAEQQGQMLESLIDTSIPPLTTSVPFVVDSRYAEQPKSASPDIISRQESPIDATNPSPTLGHESVRLMANVSLDEMVTRGLTATANDASNERPAVPPRPVKASTFPLPLPAGDQQQTQPVPEMQERVGGSSPFLLQGGNANPRPATSAGVTTSTMELMDLDEQDK